MHDFFFGHFGVDWVAAAFMFLSLWRLAEHKRDGFLYAALASLAWIIFNIMVESAPGIIANAIILALSVRSFVRWKPPGAGGGGKPTDPDLYEHIATGEA